MTKKAISSVLAFLVFGIEGGALIALGLETTGPLSVFCFVFGGPALAILF